MFTATASFSSICVAIGGALGAISRYGVQQWCVACGLRLPGTVIVNLAGCFLIGVLSGVLNAINAPVWASRLLIAGLLGGFTTFSSFALDFVNYIEAGRWLNAIAYATLSVAGGIILCFAALKITGIILGTANLTN